MKRVLVIDNYDSFTYNLVQYLGELGSEVEVVRNDKAEVGELLERGADRLGGSPGPCPPAAAGGPAPRGGPPPAPRGRAGGGPPGAAIRVCPGAATPVLGVCLGHQAMV